MISTRRTTALLASLFLCNTLAQAQTHKLSNSKATAKAVSSGLKTHADSVSYAFGVLFGKSMASVGVKNINYLQLNKALQQTFSGQATQLSPEQANLIFSQVAVANRNRMALPEKEKGLAFLAKNKSRAGVVQLPSGLQYEILVKGTGAVPTRSDTVSANYKGTLLDGKEFDNSYTRGQPLTIPVSGVIPGWTEALTLMPTGSKWKLYIPSELAYGDNGAGRDIPPGATLIFEVELLKIYGKKP